MWLVRRLALLAALSILGVAATAAWATPPGKNGRIVFRRYLDAARTTGALFTVNPDGTRVGAARVGGAIGGRGSQA